MEASAPPVTNDSVVIHSPAIPHVSVIPDGMFPGRAIVIKGLLLANAGSAHKRFNVDLCCGLLVSGDHTDNKALHFNPRLSSGDSDIVLNSLINNRWGTEERFPNVFKEGQAFQLRILALKDCFKIAVNGRHLCDYLHRIPMDEIQTIFINGGIQIDFIEYQGEVPEKVQNVNPATSASPVATGPIYKPLFKPLPFKLPLGNGFVPTRIIHLTGIPRLSAEGFVINLRRKEEYFLHFRVYFATGQQKETIVRNSTHRGVWQKEEREMCEFPFKKGATFDVELKAGTSCCLIAINGAHFAKFIYRGHIQPENVEYLHVDGDIQLLQVVLK